MRGKLFVFMLILVFGTSAFLAGIMAPDDIRAGIIGWIEGDSDTINGESNDKSAAVDSSLSGVTTTQ